jgi:hypothetical protein
MFYLKPPRHISTLPIASVAPPPMTSDLPPGADTVTAGRHVSKVPILLRKSFWGGERKFLEPLMRFMRGNVRDHIVSSKIELGPP